MRRALGRLASRLFPALARAFINARTLALAHGQIRGTATNAAGEPIPWHTYPAVEYLSQFDWRDASVFEFGSGSSSLFWAARARRVRSVETSREWQAKVAAHGLANLQVFLREDKAGYLACLAEQGERFDLIVVDGRWRQSCAALAPAHLREDGMILLDDCERYPDTARALRAAGFLQIDFNGFGPINSYAWTTSLFVRGAIRLQKGFAHPRPIGGLAPSAPEDA